MGTFINSAKDPEKMLHSNTAIIRGIRIQLDNKLLASQNIMSSHYTFYFDKLNRKVGIKYIKLHL